MIQVQPYDTILEEVTIDAPAERVFGAFVDAHERMTWWAHHEWVATASTSDVRPGGQWEVRVRGEERSTHAQGEYLIVDSPRLAVFTWRASWFDSPCASLVRIEVQENNGSSTLRVIHSGLVTDVERSAMAGWPSLLATFKAYVEQGG